MIRLVVFAALMASSAWAASTQIWELADYQDLLTGEFSGVSLDEEGRLVLAPKVEQLFRSEEAVIWTAIADAKGRIYAGTGHLGRLLRFTGSEVEELWRAPEIEIFALALGPDGALYAGTSPNGKVYRISPNGEGKVYFEPGQEYIWSLRFGKDGALFVGTGPEGKIFRVQSAGKGEEYFDSGQRHVISLGIDPQGRLLAGTDPNGVLYRISGDGEAFALYDSDLPEVRAIEIDSEGRIVFAGMGGAISLSDQATQSVNSATTVSVTASVPGGSSNTILAGGSQQNVSTQSSGVTVSQPNVNYGVETSAIYRLEPDSGIRKLWTSTEENALGLALRGDRIVFATDKDGRVLALDADERPSVLNENRSNQLSGLFEIDDAVLLTSAHPGELRRLSHQAAPKGTYTTGVHDAGAIARWGAISWRGGGAVALQTRTGNVGQPDTSWSDWSAAIRETGAPITSPPARYMQWRAELTAGSEAPVIESVRVAYLPQNQPPKVTSISVDAVDTDSSSGNSGKSSDSSSSSSYSITVTAAADGGSGVSSAGSTKEQKVGARGSARLAVSWAAEDPDDGKLWATVEFRGEGESAWKTLESRIKKNQFVLDGEALADGRYRFRVSVTDSPANPPAAARSASKISQPVLIDHTPPRVTLSGAGRLPAIRFEAHDDASPLTSAEYSVDAGIWRPVLSADGLLDSVHETFEVRPQNLEPGERLIVLRVRDAAGNAGLAKAIVER